jgi:hypothetical protein
MHAILKTYTSSFNYLKMNRLRRERGRPVASEP